MQHYKDPDNQVHFIDPAFAHLLPNGCVPITAEEAAALLPVSDWRTPMTLEMRTRRDKLLNVMDGIQSDFLTDGDIATALIVKQIKHQLKMLPTDAGILAATNAATFKAAVKAAYNVIATGAPAPVVTAILGYE